MIGKLKGKLIETEGSVGLIETTSGVSFEIFLLPDKLSAGTNKEIEVFTYLQVRDDALVLFGFSNKKQLYFFKLLLTVSGVGPKTAYSVLSHVPLDEVIIAIKTNDVGYFTRIPGLGKKTSMKIILELSQKLHTEFKLDKMSISEDDKTAIDALVSLGFKSQDAKQMVSRLPRELSVEDKIKAALNTPHEKK